MQYCRYAVFVSYVTVSYVTLPYLCRVDVLHSSDLLANSSVERESHRGVGIRAINIASCSE